MTDWVRLWHDMPTDPKWRTIARKSGQRVGDVIAVFTFLMVNASANAAERGRTHGIESEDIASALDIEGEDVDAILAAMEGRVIVEGALTGWEKRQPKREDGSAERGKAFRERKRTHQTAKKRPETEAETDKIALPDGNDLPVDAESLDAESRLWAGGLKYLIGASGLTDAKARTMIGKWRKDNSAEAVLRALMVCYRESTPDPISYITRVLTNDKKSDGGFTDPLTRAAAKFTGGGG